MEMPRSYPLIVSPYKSLAPTENPYAPRRSAAARLESRPGRSLARHIVCAAAEKRTRSDRLVHAEAEGEALVGGHLAERRAALARGRGLVATCRDRVPGDCRHTGVAAGGLGVDRGRACGGLRRVRSRAGFFDRLGALRSDRAAAA